MSADRPDLPPATLARSAGRLAGAAGRAAGRAAATPHAQRRETALILWWLAADLLSIPFHVLAFLLTRTRHRRDFQRALKDAAP